MNKIKEARKAAGLSQKYVALALGLKGPSVSNWESGKTQPTPENLKALANLFNVSVDYLLDRDDLPQEETADTKTEPIPEDELQHQNALTLTGLTPEEMQRVMDFVDGLKAGRK